MLRITRQPPADGTITFKVEGRLVGPWTCELQRVGRAALVDGADVVFDLADLTFADRVGIDVLRSLCAGGASVRGESSFVQALLKGDECESHR